MTHKKDDKVGKMRVASSPSQRVQLVSATEAQNQLYSALKSLFELLEKYSPLWYKKKYQEEAKAALRLALAAHHFKFSSTLTPMKSKPALH
jgi:hypothetical protein